MVAAAIADPILTANIYASGELDSLIQYAIIPAVQQISEQDSSSFAWVVRYSRLGEHLKLRLHGPGSQCDRWKIQVGTSVNRWLASRQASEEVDRKISLTQTAIDLEDEGDQGRQDGTLLWTHYRRSYVSLPASPWLEDEDLVYRFCKCLASGLRVAGKALASQLEVGRDRRRITLVRAIAHLLPSRLPRNLEWISYMEYHRDWLIRAASSEKDITKIVSALSVTQMSHQETALLLRALCETSLDREAELQSFSQKILDLLRYTERFEEHGDYRFDEYARAVSFPPLFKALHGLANQLGITIREEALTYQQMVQALATSEARG